MGSPSTAVAATVPPCCSRPAVSLGSPDARSGHVSNKTSRQAVHEGANHDDTPGAPPSGATGTEAAAARRRSRAMGAGIMTGRRPRNVLSFLALAAAFAGCDEQELTTVGIVHPTL